MKEEKDLTYEELLQKVKEQELLIKELNDEKQAITNFEYFVKESPDLICITDFNAYFKVVNDSLIKVLGYSRDEIFANQFFNLIHPDDRDKTKKEIDKLTKNCPTIDFENRYIKKNGELVVLQWKANLHTCNKLIYSIARDITDIKKTEEKLLTSEKSLNEAQKIAKIGSWDFNLVTQELFWSNELYKIFEFENIPNDTQLYPKYLSCFSPEDLEEFNQNVNFTIVNKVPYEMEHRITLEDQKIKWVFCTGVPILDDNKNVVGLRGVVQDITQKKQINETISAKEKAEAANKAKSDFLANMSHEIRTPLNGIVGFTDLLLKTKCDNDQLEYLKTVNESANTLMEIVNNILDFSKIESGKIELNSDEIDIIQLSNQIINLFKYEANHKRIELLLDIDPSVPKYIKGDAFRLKQVLVNLLSNAMKFTAAGFIKLRLALMEQEETISKIKFSVIDTGIGIKDDNQKKIFQSFIQADNTTTRKYGGTGLGLTISSQLLALKNSELQLSSVYGSGSEFFFILSSERMAAKDNDFVAKEIEKEPSLPLSRTLANFKVLIAEDNKINMFLAKTLIHKTIKNCQLIEATNGQEAVIMAEEFLPDLILMDIQMPIQNGYDATIAIRKKEIMKGIPVIALTAGVLNGEKEKCMQYGMSDYITKPILPAELEKVLHKWLKK